MPKLFVSITIDTEPDADIRWRIRYPFAFSSVTRGIPGILRPLFDRYGIRPVYFVSPAVLEDQAAQGVLAAEAAAGAEIGSHLHIEDFSLSPAGQKRDFACYAYPDDVEYDKIKRLDERIRRTLGVIPASFRAGRFGADIGTARSLVKLGYHVDASVTPHIDWSPKGGPDFREYPDQPYFVDVGGGTFNGTDSRSSLLEVPVTIGGKRFPGLPEKWFLRRWLRPSFMTVIEQKLLIGNFIEQYRNEPVCVLCMMFHTTELMPGASPYVRTGRDQAMFIRRLDAVAGYLKARGAMFVTLEDIYREYAELRTV
ncbi:MAG: hypothetical protein PHS37_07145 [Candidatus Omnitrophica bacterium]|nr:hypothetical protein [Candidatus Omnitrophota bacterium]